MDLIGRPLDGYDYMTFAALLLILVTGMAALLFIMGLLGRIALQRNHPHAESVKIMGYMGFLVVVPWVHAFMWAFHDSATVDIRRFPERGAGHRAPRDRAAAGRARDAAGGALAARREHLTDRACTVPTEPPHRKMPSHADGARHHAFLRHLRVAGVLPGVVAWNGLNEGIERSRSAA